MPGYNRNYRRRNYRRRRYPRRPYKKPMRYKVADMAYKGFVLAKKVAKLVNVEMKHHDFMVDGTNTAAGQLITLNQVPQGDTDQSRDGDSLKMQKMVLKLNAIKAAGATDTFVRFILFHDPQNSTANVAPDFLEPTYINTNRAHLSHKDKDNQFKTKKIWDQTYRLDANKTSIQLEKVFSLSHHTQYEAGTTTINSGALKLIIINNEVSTNFPTIRFVNRLFFTDN